MKNITKKRANKEGILIIFLFLISFISASCNGGQIDINSASAKELDKIAGVGEAIAERIIGNRTYNSVDDLLRVKGIGEATLEKIKTQGIACVGEENVKEYAKEILKTTESEENSEPPAIYLNSEVSKDIKTENNKENLRKNLPLYGVIAFCAVFGMVFLIKQRKKRHGFE
jgi:competence ComEA-like helix-hairpin-helix protein